MPQDSADQLPLPPLPLDRENLERSAQLALDGSLALVINAVHPLSDAPAALATVENGHASGKIVIKVA